MKIPSPVRLVTTKLNKPYIQDIFRVVRVNIDYSFKIQFIQKQAGVIPSQLIKHVSVIKIIKNNWRDHDWNLLINGFSLIIRCNSS